MTHAITAYYDHLYKSKGAEAFPFDSARYREILSHIPEGGGMDALDFGCGDGSLIHLLFGKGYRAFVYDISESALELAGKQILQFFILRTTDQIEARRPFSLITSMGVFEHVPNLGETLLLLYGSMAPGGYGLFMVANSQSPFRWFGGTGQIYEEAKSIGHWKAYFMDAGFKIESITRDPGPCFGWRKGVWKNLKIAAHRVFEWFAPLDYTYQLVFVVRK